jgi:hypothetical protein
MEDTMSDSSGPTTMVVGPGRGIATAFARRSRHHYDQVASRDLPPERLSYRRSCAEMPK